MFPIDELSIIGISAILKNLPALLGRIREVADAVIAQKPDVLVLVDGPEFTHRVARRVRRAAPHIPIVDYVAPTVWAWRPWRARSMRSYVDHVMAVLPFEPKVMTELGGPPTTYVGHPLLERLGDLTPSEADLARRRASPPLLLVLPGSRRGELRRLMPVFGETLDRVSRSFGPLDVVLPTLPHLRAMVEEMASSWTVPVRIVDDGDSRRQAFRQARAALVKSGTVTLELALAGVPMVAAYQVALIEELIAHLLVNAPSAILANLVLGENVVPEFLQRRCNPELLSATLLTVLDDGPARQAQLQAFTRLGALMETGHRTPRERAADVVMATFRAS
jgi:lipid-A-disaccharide synthase